LTTNVATSTNTARKIIQKLNVVTVNENASPIVR
jgi:hypothetical protein